MEKETKKDKEKRLIKKSFGKQKIVVLHNEFMQIFCVTNNEIQNDFVAKKKIYQDSDFKVEIRGEQENIIFERQSYMLYCILFDYYINNQEKLDKGYLIISFKEIHKLYRGKEFNCFGKIDIDTLNSYQAGIKDLYNKKIRMILDEIKIKEKRKYAKVYISDFPKKSIEQRLVEYELIRNDKNEVVSVKYKLGDFGELMLKSKRMSSILPIELLQVSYKEMAMFYIGMYIAKLIYIAKKKKEKKKSVRVKTLLTNIMCFSSNGSKKGITKYEEIKQAKQKNGLMKNFEEQLRAVLYCFVKNEIIYQGIITVDKLTAKNYELDSTEIVLEITGKV